MTSELLKKQEYEHLLPQLTHTEYGALKESIKRNGLYSAIVVNEKGEILDGYHRFKICMELGIKPSYKVEKFNDDLAEKKFAIESNLRRRQLNDFQKAEIGIHLLGIEKEEAKRRQIELGKSHGVTESDPLAPFDAKGKTTEVVAKKLGLSTRTFERAKKIIEEGSELQKQQLRIGKHRIGYAHQMLVDTKRIVNAPPMPDGVFDVILADPPWQYDAGMRGDPREHYHTMKLEEIASLKVPAAEDSILFLWATNPKLEDALKVMKAWGFTYRTNLCWLKQKQGTGYYVRGQHELLLIGTKGKIGTPLEENRPPSVIPFDATDHSRKPEESYSIIEKMYPYHKYLEMFSRLDVELPNWTHWRDNPN